MTDLEYLAEDVMRKRADVEDLEVEIEQAQSAYRAARAEYVEKWDKAFWQLVKESRLSWCTWCGAVRDAEFLVEGYDLYTKSENYGPEFAHTSTKHRVCSQCEPRLQSKSKAQAFRAMFSEDDTGDLPNDETLAELCARIKLPPREP